MTTECILSLFIAQCLTVLIFGSYEPGTPQQPDQWDLVIQTCTEEGAGTNAAVFAKLSYTNHDQETFSLDSPRDDFEQGSRDHFRIELTRNDPIKFGLYWWPSGTLGESFCVKWAILLNPAQDKCYVAVFDKWIGHYNNPPTYPDFFKGVDYAQCVDLPFKKPDTL